VKKVYKCTNCSKEFKRYESTVRREDRVFCCKRCSYDYMATLRTGEDNPNYKTGKYTDPICGCGKQKDPRSHQCSKCARKSKGVAVDNVIDDSVILETIKECKSFLEMSKVLDATRWWITKRVMELGIDISHFVKCNHRPNGYEDIMIEGSSVTQPTLKKYVLSNDIVEYVCNKCSNDGVWMDNPITLELHHINGNNKDNREDNLEFLCPNCHTQTPNSRGKKR
jgi:DNA-directed RNA polymerase subunit RPC12/RpoP